MSRPLISLLIAIVIVLVGVFASQLIRAVVAWNHVGPVFESIAHVGSARFLVVGDTGSGDGNQRAVADAMNTRCEQGGGEYKGLVLLGDNVYPDGVSSTSDPLWASRVDQPYNLACLSGLPIYPVVGNHDNHGNIDAQIQYTRIHDKWTMPARFYTRMFQDLVTLHFIDTTRADFFLPVPGTFAARLDEALDFATPWHLVFGHYPIHSGCDDRPSQQDPWRMWWIAQRICSRTDLYMAGHIHFMEHMEAPDICEASMYTVGTGGAPLRPIDGACSSETKFASSQFGFSEVDVSTERLTVRLFSKSGTLLDEYVKTKP